MLTSARCEWTEEQLALAKALELWQERLDKRLSKRDEPLELMERIGRRVWFREIVEGLCAA